MAFADKLNRVLSESAGKRYTINHRSGKAIAADFVKKIKSPFGGRILYVVGINPIPPSVNKARKFVTGAITHRLREVFKHVKSNPNRLAYRPGRGVDAYEEVQKDLVIPLYEHILCIGANNVVNLSDSQVSVPPTQPVPPMQQSTQPPVQQPQPQAQVQPRPTADPTLPQQR